MRVRFEFEIEPREIVELDPEDFADCQSLAALEDELLDIPDPNWRVFVNDEDLAAMWAEIEKARAE